MEERFSRIVCGAKGKSATLVVTEVGKFTLWPDRVAHRCSGRVYTDLWNGASSTHLQARVAISNRSCGPARLDCFDKDNICPRTSVW